MDNKDYIGECFDAPGLFYLVVHRGNKVYYIWPDGTYHDMLCNFSQLHNRGGKINHVSYPGYFTSREEAMQVATKQGLKIT